MVDARLTSVGMGSILILIGLALVVFVFIVSYNAYKTFEANVEPGDSILETIAFNSSLLIELLIKVAFLALALAAGSVILTRGVDLAKGCGRE